MPVQDDERERELVRLFNLDWDPAHQRAGVDAILVLQRPQGMVHVEVEVKSTTGGTVSTARDFGMSHIEKLRRKLFVIGFYSKEPRRPELQRCLCLTPVDMAPWIDAKEAEIGIDHRIAQRVSLRLTEADLVEVCGGKPHYTIEDAKRVLRQQWTSEQYQQAPDMVSDEVPVLSRAAMLDVLRLRARYIAERGATLNNPHVPKAFLAPFFGTSREVGSEWAARIRGIANEWLDSA